MQPWDQGKATNCIRDIARSENLSIAYTTHARDRMSERGLVVSDVLYALKNGFVYIAPEKATRGNLYRYRVECKTPNSNSRTIGVVLIPDNKSCFIKIISVMWVDEHETRSGNVIGGDDDE